jgi:GT2 family glycosyltransferase/glycosyltransferase involved in cell wall biosynthesis
MPIEPDFLDYALGGYGARRDAATADAFERVGAHLLAGRPDKALAMLEYAQRLAPSDGGISLAIGLLGLKLGEPRAAAPLEKLGERTGWRDVWMAMVRVRLRLGTVGGAAAALHTTFSQNGPPTKPADIALANTVSQRAGAAGWCALSNAGRLTIGSPLNLTIGLTILLDGIRVSDETPRAPPGLREIRLPECWQTARSLTVLLRGQPLLGSPIDIARVTRVEGFVEALPASGGLRGWCWFPAERERAPLVTIASLADPARCLSVHADMIDPSLVRNDGLALPYGFAIDAHAIETFGDALTVTGPHGHTLYGSPLSRRLTDEASRPVVASGCRLSPAALEAPAPPPSARRTDIVIPVHTGLAMTLACIDAVRAELAESERVIVVSDASPDPELVAALHALAADGHIVLRAETVNRGFPATVNIGLRLAEGNDVVLLNSDTIVTPGWVAGLRAAAHSAADIGTATPLSNDATIFSYPRHDIVNPYPDAPAELGALAAEANAGIAVEVPTGHGFCLYIRAECLQQTGLLRDDVFAQGYGEENDFCMRARHLGWRHVAAPGVFVAHVGSQSFSAARHDLRRRNLETLNRLHVGYDALIARWLEQDPLHESRRRIDLARLRRARAGRESVLLVTHDREGGIRHYVTDRVAAIRRSGRHALVLRPANEKNEHGRVVAQAVALDTGSDDPYPNLRFRVPAERGALLSSLADSSVVGIEVNSLVGHADSLVDLLLAQDVPIDVVIHDYSWFCPRITLTTGDHRYCGEPAMAACHDCTSAYGSSFDEDMLPDRLTTRSRRLIQAARSLVAPSADAARRIRNRFGVDVTVGAWEEPQRLRLKAVEKTAGRVRPVRIGVVGAIGPEKGYHSLLRCAQHVAANGLPLEFVVIGYTCDDKRLLDTGAVHITGRYAESEVVALIAAQKLDFGWLPAIWPETWSYVLTRLWEAGLFVVVNDIGAPAERVHANGGGLVIPLHLPPDRLAGLFLNPELFRSDREVA